MTFSPSPSQTRNRKQSPLALYCVLFYIVRDLVTNFYLFPRFFITFNCLPNKKLNFDAKSDRSEAPFVLLSSQERKWMFCPTPAVVWTWGMRLEYFWHWLELAYEFRHWLELSTKTRGFFQRTSFTSHSNLLSPKGFLIDITCYIKKKKRTVHLSFTIVDQWNWMIPQMLNLR